MRECSVTKPVELAAEFFSVNEELMLYKTDCRIITKVHFGKKEFVFEFQR